MALRISYSTGVGMASDECRIDGLAAHGVKVVVQPGDFRMVAATQVRPQTLMGWRPRAGVEVLFIDGNHEHHTDLRAHARQADPESENGRPVLMHPRLWYLPRGCAWQWAGVRFRALGGAYSVDRPSRTPGKSWFPEEVPTVADAERAIAAGPADVFLCHDHPALGYEIQGVWGIAEEHERASRQVQQIPAEVAEAIGPQLVVHGHWHRRYSIERDGISVEGLDCDNTASAALILDLDTLQTRDWPTPTPKRW